MSERDEVLLARRGLAPREADGALGLGGLEVEKLDARVGKLAGGSDLGSSVTP